MEDESKTKKQLICELMEYRQRVAKLGSVREII